MGGPTAARIDSTLVPNNGDAPYPEFSPTGTWSVGEDKYVDGAHFFRAYPRVLFIDPVTLDCHTYERSAIMTWFVKAITCHVTGKALERQPVPLTNFILKRIIEKSFKITESPEINGKSREKLQKLKDATAAERASMAARASAELSRQGKTTW